MYKYAHRQRIYSQQTCQAMLKLQPHDPTLTWTIFVSPTQVPPLLSSSLLSFSSFLCLVLSFSLSSLVFFLSLPAGYLFLCLSVCLSVCVSVCLSVSALCISLCLLFLLPSSDSSPLTLNLSIPPLFFFFSFISSLFPSSFLV